MKSSFKIFMTLICVAIATPAQAIYTELGLTYGRKTTTFDENNSFDTESTTGSISLYLMERMALEFSYTSAYGLRKEKASSSDAKRITTQTSQISGADLILTFADRKSFFQPYIKGGGAQISRFQEVKIEGQDSFKLQPESASVPSYGAGLKIQMTETFGVKMSYDVWKTPIGGGLQTDDASIRAGINWIL